MATARNLPYIRRPQRDLWMPFQHRTKCTSRSDERIEYHVQVERRPADDFEHVGGGGLLLQRLVALTQCPVQFFLRVGCR